MIPETMKYTRVKENNSFVLITKKRPWLRP